MPIIPVNFGQVTHEFIGIGLPTGGAVTYGITKPVSGSASETAELLHDAFDDSVLNQLSDDIALQRTIVKFGPSETGPSGEFVDTRTGSITGDGSSAAVAALCRKITELGGRKGRGRWYLPGMAEANVTSGGALNATYLGNLNTDLEVFRAFIDGTVDAAMVLLHNDLTTPTLVTELVAQGTVATQRRRQRR